MLSIRDRYPRAHSRDIIDLAMMRADRPLLLAARVKAEAAYGASIRESVENAVRLLREQPSRLDGCMKALRIGPVSKAQLWQAIRTVRRRLVA